MNEVYFKGKGEAYLRKLGGNTGLVPLGNSSSIVVSQAIEQQKVKSYKTAGGGTAKSHNAVSAVTAKLSTYNFNPANLAIAAAGSYGAVVGGAVVAEALTVISQGTLVPLRKLPDVSVAVTVTGPSGTPTYVDGTDYELRNTGLFIVDGGGISAGNIEVSYTAADGFDVEALVSTGDEYELVFDGINEGEAGGKQQRLTGYRVKVSPASDLPLISDDFAQLNMDIEFLEDPTVTGTGKSKYFKIQTVA